MSDKQLIYVVSEIEYETNTLLNQGYFSSRELAEAAMRRKPNGKWAEIEEVELDDLANFEPEDEIKYKIAYACSIKIIGGQETVARETSVEDDGLPGVVKVTTDTSSFYPHYHFIHVTSEISAEHAIQVAEEARRKYIQENEGKLDYDPDWHLKNRFSE